MTTQEEELTRVKDELTLVCLDVAQAKEVLKKLQDKQLFLIEKKWDLETQIVGVTKVPAPDKKRTRKLPKAQPDPTFERIVVGGKSYLLTELLEATKMLIQK